MLPKKSKFVRLFLFWFIMAVTSTRVNNSKGTRKSQFLRQIWIPEITRISFVFQQNPSRRIVLSCVELVVERRENALNAAAAPDLMEFGAAALNSQSHWLTPQHSLQKRQLINKPSEIAFCHCAARSWRLSVFTSPYWTRIILA